MIVDEKNYISEFQAHHTCFRCNLFFKTPKSIFQQSGRFERTLSCRISVGELLSLSIKIIESMREFLVHAFSALKSRPTGLAKVLWTTPHKTHPIYTLTNHKMVCLRANDPGFRDPSFIKIAKLPTFQ